MAENKNQVLDMAKVGFGLLSTKVKLIIIGVAVGIFIVVIFPIVAIMSIFSSSNNQSNQKKQEETSAVISINEVIDEGSMYKYQNATFPMPFETWNSSKDVVTSRFSKSRTITIAGRTQTRAHTGIDLVCISKGSPKICAVASGKVVVDKPLLTSYGNYVVIEHKADDGRTFYTLYGHLKHGSIAVAEGTEVKVGQVLGIMGSTGNSTGAHLHFEVRLDNNSSSSTVDPYSYLFGG